MSYPPSHPEESEPTRPLPPYPPAQSGGSRKGFAAAVLTASLLVGGAAGFGGAAAWDAVSPDQRAATTTTSGTGAEDTPTSVEPVVDAPEGSVEQVAQQVLPSVVRLDVAGPEGQGSGSGIILSEDGTILTNEHVISLAAAGGSLRVSFTDGTQTSGRVLGSDKLTDTAIVQAEDVSGLTPATIGRSEDLRVGQDVVAIGSPFGLDATVTSGIVSALDRPVNVGSDEQGNATTYPAIQTDAAINPGNSGGPLVDLAGQVVGINSSIRSVAGAAGEAGSIGLGFAIPIDAVMPLVPAMEAGEAPEHARIGIRVGDVDSSDGRVGGAQVDSVEPGTGAEEAGLQAGDIITQVDDRHIENSDALIATVRAHRPGDTVTITWLRDGEESSAEVTLSSDAD